MVPQSNNIRAYTRQRARPVNNKRASYGVTSSGSEEFTDIPPPARARTVVSRSPLMLREDLGADNNMARYNKREKDEDLFLQLAQDDEENAAPRYERVSSRLSQHDKRRSLPAEAALDSTTERRPKSSGNVFPRASSRLNGLTGDAQRQRFSPSREPVVAEDAVSLSGRSVSGRTNRFSSGPTLSRLAERVRSPEMPLFGRRRPSYGAASSIGYRSGQTPGKPQDSQEESPADSSEPKRSLPDSNSVDSQTADTVWDELDDLKSRIKKLELTGKLPPTSAAAVSGESAERPRTATTAPTTIDSSPKREKKPEPSTPADLESKQSVPENTVGGPSSANIHPLLHSALAKARPLLNPMLYRSLEATASDALQLAAMTGSAGPQGTTFSAASIINGVTASDRHVRRKADTMCRNLTDLTLALCEGKHEAASVTNSPVVLEPVRNSPSIRYSRSSLGVGEAPPGANRPMSRLEARRSSILGIPPGGSPRDRSVGDVSVSASDVEATPPTQGFRRTSRTASRLLAARQPRFEDVSGDEDPTMRPPSRAMTDAGAFRARLTSRRESAHLHDSPSATETPSDFKSFLNARRSRDSNSGAFNSNKELSRAASLNLDSRRRWTKEATPPPVVVEEEGSDGEFVSQRSLTQPKRRVVSQFAGESRRESEGLGRRQSLGLRRGLAVE